MMIPDDKEIYDLWDALDLEIKEGKLGPQPTYGLCARTAMKRIKDKMQVDFEKQREEMYDRVLMSKAELLHGNVTELVVARLPEDSARVYNLMRKLEELSRENARLNAYFTQRGWDEFNAT